MPHSAIASVHKPPELQEVAQGINNLVAPKARVPVVGDLVPTLAFTLSADQILRRLFWSMDEFTLSGANTQVVFQWPTIPQTETRRYLHIWLDEPRVKPQTNLLVIYPSQSILGEEVGGVIARGEAGGTMFDFLSPGNHSSLSMYPGLPVDVFPSGRLQGETTQPLAAGDTLKVFSVWERLPPPNIARAEVEPLNFIEAP